ncbi:hypothetical protein LAUMK35_04871 [Mycobacterium pseudokansasii]|uniref:Uncharacterized protein n=1 Tax=Mycobacterium pseudokansasii TaxID=2341080 RepID=A0A498QYQ7_9MYCO|nr:hypothetical protein LAUMK35_04871 [Mycobacterium pseudokansasii]VBA32795.1 hypothetical protein LAUMK21_04861 [Mycobacterium pseudokansasii]VBA54729.1 hypothetical protein LAUMK142_04775 [Mycobacterium pseudokansasii]
MSPEPAVPNAPVAEAVAAHPPGPITVAGFPLHVGAA